MELKEFINNRLAAKLPDTIPERCAVEKPRDFDPFGQTGFAHLWLQYD